MHRTGWTIHEVEGWTRRRKNEKERKTNIDIIATTRIPRDNIDIKKGDYNGEISDHIPIEIEIKDISDVEEVNMEEDKVINK